MKRKKEELDNLVDNKKNRDGKILSLEEGSQEEEDQKKKIATKKKDQNSKTMTKSLITPETHDTIGSLSKATGLSTFMLLVISDLYDRKTKKFNKSETIINVVFPNTNIRALNQTELDKYRPAASSNKNKEKPLSIDQSIKLVLAAKEKELKDSKILVGGTTNQYVDIPRREKDTLMLHEFVGYVVTKSGYFIYVFYTGPTDKGKNNVELTKHENWRIVHKSHLRYFHTRITKIADYYTHTKNDQNGTKDEKFPAYDPRYIIYRWMGAATSEPLIEIIKQNIGLLQNRDDFLVSDYKKKKQLETINANTAKKNMQNSETTTTQLSLVDEEDDSSSSPVLPSRSKKPKIQSTDDGDRCEVIIKKFDPISDREEQAKRGFAITNDPEFCQIFMKEFPSVYRCPIPENMTLTMDELIYLGKRVDQETPEKDWNPSILAKALIIAHNHESHIKRCGSIITDRHLQILERDNITPILDLLTTNQDAINFVKESTSQYIYSVLATELISRDIPPEMEERFPIREALIEEEEEEEEDENEKSEMIIDS